MELIRFLIGIIFEILYALTYRKPEEIRKKFVSSESFMNFINLIIIENRKKQKIFKATRSIIDLIENKSYNLLDYKLSKNKELDDDISLKIEVDTFKYLLEKYPRFVKKYIHNFIDIFDKFLVDDELIDFTLKRIFNDIDYSFFENLKKVKLFSQSDFIIRALSIYPTFLDNFCDYSISTNNVDHFNIIRSYGYGRKILPTLTFLEYYKDCHLEINLEEWINKEIYFLSKKFEYDEKFKQDDEILQFIINCPNFIINPDHFHLFDRSKIIPYLKLNFDNYSPSVQKDIERRYFDLIYIDPKSFINFCIVILFILATKLFYSS